MNNMEQGGLDNETPRVRLIKKFAYLIGLIGGATLFASLAVYAWNFRGNGLSVQPEDWEALGAYLGGLVGAVVGVATLAALAATWYLQAKELELSRRAARRQLFESTFFQMMKQFADIAASVEFVGRKGREAFQFLHENLQGPPLYPQHVTPSQADYLRDVTHVFNQLYGPREHYLGPYYRSLYHVFKFVNNEESLNAQEKTTYANLARAQLSRYELALLFYDALTPRAKGFKPLIETYGVFKHLNAADIKNTTYGCLYKPTALMSTDERDRYQKHAPLDPEEMSDALKLFLASGGYQWWPDLTVVPAH